MRAARFYGPHDIRVDDVTEPEVGQGMVHVDVEWCGICGSDLHLYALGGGHLRAPLPFTLGHELCGRVRNPPAGSRFKGGEPVMVDPRIVCRSCNACKSGNDDCCSQLGYVGGTVPGGYGERVAVDERSLHILPDSIPLEYAAVIEPLAVVVHAIKESNVKDWGEKEILILGAGPVGFALIIALRDYGAKKIFVSEPASRRREQIAEFSSAVINPIKDNVVERCNELTGGRGVDIVFDCAGVPAGLESAFDAIRFKGLYMNVAVWEKPMTLPCWKFLAKHITIKGVLIFDDEDFTDVMNMISAGRLEGYQKMVTGRIPLDDIKEKGFQVLLDNKDEHIKILVSPKATLNASNGSD